MKNYAVLDYKNNVVNVITAPSQSIAEEVTSSVCVYVTDSTGIAQIGLRYIDGIFATPPDETVIIEPVRPEATE